MGSPATERVKRWRTRNTLRSAFFEENDKRRRRLLEHQFAATAGDPRAVLAVREFFLSYPRCFVAPYRIAEGHGFIGAVFPSSLPVVGWEHTAAVYALLAAGFPNAAQTFSWDDQNVSFSPMDEAHVAETRAEVQALIAEGLWTRSKPTTPARSVVRSGQ